jgi:hypothetical protein
MKIRQTVRHIAAKKALETPVLGDRVHDRLVDLHTSVFLDMADEVRAEERRDRLDALFDATVDAYLAALQEGHTEAEAREITHVMANFDFYNHGWTEMMEFPADEVEEHYERHRGYFERHGITIDDPLGEFADVALPDAPATPEKLEDPEHPHAEGGFADDVYVEDDEGRLSAGDADLPEDGDVELDDAPGVTDGAGVEQAEDGGEA